MPNILHYSSWHALNKSGLLEKIIKAFVKTWGGEQRSLHVQALYTCSATDMTHMLFLTALYSGSNLRLEILFHKWKKLGLIHAYVLKLKFLS